MPKTSDIGKRLPKTELVRMEIAMCTLANNESIIYEACGELGVHPSCFHDVLRALRLIVDGRE